MYKKYFINNVIFLILSVMTSMSSYAQNWSKLRCRNLHTFAKIQVDDI